jgi:hypothetical protein
MQDESAGAGDNSRSFSRVLIGSVEGKLTVNWR